MFLGIDQMRAHMILDHLGHQAGHGAAGASQQVHDLFAASFTVEGALDGFHLAPEAAYAGQQFLPFPDRMGHWINMPYRGTLLHQTIAAIITRTRAVPLTLSGGAG
jgi:hypothetical protein